MRGIGRGLTAAGTLLVLVAGVAPGSAHGAGPPGRNGHGAFDLERSTIPDLQRAMRSGRLSSARLTAVYLRRIERIDGRLRTVIAVHPRALDQARASDRRRARGRLRGPLDGIPVLLKDNIGTGDALPTTAGSTALRGFRPAEAFLVTRLRAAGAVVLGKANLSQWAGMRSSRAVSGWSSVGGLTPNPYRLDHSPCGSSSGSAAAVSAWLAPVAVGTETDGSLVCPGSVSGVVAVKPTRGAVSRTGIVPISLRQDTPGPLARNTADAALLLGVLWGFDPADPATRGAARHAPPAGAPRWDAPAGAALHGAGLHGAGLHGVRLGVWRSSVRDGGPEIGRVVDGAVARLRSLGATVVDPVEPPPVDRAPEFAALLCEFKHDLGAFLARTPGGHPRTLADVIAHNRAHAGTEMPLFGQDYLEAAQQTSGDPADPACARPREAAERDARAALDGTLAGHRLDAIVAPTTVPGWKVDLSRGDPPFGGSAPPPAIAGHPHVTVPAGLVSGLPVGLSLIGPRWSDPRLLRYAGAFERSGAPRTPPFPVPRAP